MNHACRVLLVLVSAGLGICVFPPVGWWWLAVVAWLPLLFALGGVRRSVGMYLGLLHGVVFYGVTLSWLVDVFMTSWFQVAPLVLIMALFTGVFARGVVAARDRYGDGWVWVVFAAVWWCACEFFRSEVFYLKFPWMTPGLGLGPTWVSPLLGVSGAGFLIILGGACCLSWKRRTQFAVGAALLVVMLISAGWQLQRESPGGADVRVLAVQNEVMDIDRFIELTESAEGEFDVMVWPEHAFPNDVRRVPRQWQQLNDLVRQRDALLVVGVHKPIESGGWYNSALTLGPDGVVGEHYKNHPVHFFDDGVAHDGASALDTRIGKMGTPICFDCDYQDVIRRMVSDGAGFLVVPSMDAVHWGEKEHYQHAELVRQRAAENGRWLVVGSSSGVTQIIDPNGNRVASIPLFEEGVLSGELGKVSKLTFYTRLGWLFPWAVMYWGGLWVMVIFVRGLLGKRKNVQSES